MAELLRHQNSIAYYDNHHSGCMWGLLDFFDFHQYANKKKMLACRRHDDGTGGETKGSMPKQKIRIQPPDNEINNRINDPANAKSSGKAHMISSLFKKMTKRDRKLKNSPSAVRLLRTISIHYLECNDYMLPGELTSDSEYSGAEVNSQGADSLISRAEPNSQELDSSMSSDPSYMMAEANKQGRGVAQKELTNVSGLSSSVGGISEHTKDKACPQKRNWKSESMKIISNHKTIEESLEDIVSVRWKDFKNSIKDVIRENRKGRHRISMDGILHKVPSGYNLPEYVEKEKLKLYNNAKLEHRYIQRSCSLVESLDRYSSLLESIPYRDPKRLPERLKSLKEEDNKFAERRVLRSHSFTESIHNHALMNDSNSFRESRRHPEILKSIQENCSLPDRKSVKTFGRILSNPEILSYSLIKDIQNIVSLELASGHLAGKEEDAYVSDDPKLVGTLLNTDDPKLVGTLLRENVNLDTVESRDNETEGGLQQPLLIEEQNQNESCIVSDDLVSEENTSIYLHENYVDMERNDKPPKPSPIFVLGTHFEEDPSSSATSEIIEELPSNWIWFKVQDSTSNSESHTKDEELTKEQMPMEISEIHSFNIQVDQKDEAEFNYVRDILRKSGFSGGGEEFLRAWSPYQPLDQFLFKEADSSAHELEATADGTFDIPFHCHLMIDMINEVLLGIHESSIARSTKFTSFDPRIRPVPMGKHVLEEVWGKISWYLNPQQYTISPLDNVFTLDFAKYDKWMDLHWDIESVALEMEGLILDELIDEIII